MKLLVKATLKDSRQVYIGPTKESKKVELKLPVKATLKDSQQVYIYCQQKKSKRDELKLLIKAML